MVIVLKDMTVTEVLSVISSALVKPTTKSPKPPAGAPEAVMWVNNYPRQDEQPVVQDTFALTPR
jgi:hypothetical protein